MATLGQVVYNLRDFHSSGGLISTNKDDLSSTVASDSSVISGNYANKRLNIFDQDLVTEVFRATEFSKLGIQAPPGTKFILNGNKVIMMGRSGVYELDEDLTISGLKFVRPFRYVVNQDETDRLLGIATREGDVWTGTAADNSKIGSFSFAKSYLEINLRNLDSRYPVKNSNYWDEYVQIQTQYQEYYNDALNYYTQGVNGIYVLPSTLTPGANDYAEVYDIIVDFLY